MRTYDHLAIEVSDRDKNPHPFADLYPALLGPAGAEQFIVDQGEVVCIRPTCDGCPFKDGCEFEEVSIPTSAIPHSRRGIGFEDRPFLALRFKDGHSFETLPVELWDNPYADKAYAHEANLHWAYTDPNSAIFHTLKGHLRYYGTEAEFAASPYAEYLTVFRPWEPQHHIVSQDYSAIEPRISTLVTREPQWLKVFQGEAKAIFKEITIDPEYERLNGADYKVSLPRYITFRNSRTYCYLDGELDKEHYVEQCGKCKLQDFCKTKNEHLKKVPTDWHGINTAGLYGTEFTQGDKYRKKELRDIGKIVGLSLVYGGSAYTVANNMATSKEDAQVRIDNFFFTLTVLKAHMEQAKADVLKTGQVVNLFGRRRDVSRFAFSKAPTAQERRKDAGYAQRTALNHPIQSTAADILKIGMIRFDEFIASGGLHPYYGAGLPQHFDVIPDQRDVVIAMLSSVHDEVVTMTRTDAFDSVLPQAYIALQLEDVLQMFGVGYSLELDIEYDPHRSWTATEKYATGLVYLLRHTQGLTSVRGVPTEAAPSSRPQRPNVAIISMEEVTPDLLRKLAERQLTMSQLPERFVEDDSEWLELAVLHQNHYYFHGEKFPLSLLKGIGLSPKLSFYRQVE